MDERLGELVPWLLLLVLVLVVVVLPCALYESRKRADYRWYVRHRKALEAQRDDFEQQPSPKPPPTIVTTPGPLSDETVDAIKRHWRDRYTKS